MLRVVDRNTLDSLRRDVIKFVEKSWTKVTHSKTLGGKENILTSSSRQCCKISPPKGIGWKTIQKVSCC